MSAPPQQQQQQQKKQDQTTAKPKAPAVMAQPATTIKQRPLNRNNSTTGDQQPAPLRLDSIHAAANGPKTPGPGSAPRPRPPAKANGPQQLLERITVAGVIVEVVKQKNTIIYRLSGNTPVSSLTQEQRTVVMEEIQRRRNSQPGAARTPGTITPKSRRSASPSPGPGTPPIPVVRPVAPRIAPQQRPSSPSVRPPVAYGSQQPRSALPSIAPRSNASQSMSPAPLAKKAPSLNTVATAAASQQSAMEKMYQSAYLKLLNNPAEVLRKLSPPVDLAAVLKTRGASSEELGRSEMLLTVLKALTKSQASQLASMYDQEMKARSGGLPAISTSGLRTPTGARSGEVSPSVASMSGGESDTHQHSTPGTGMETPKKRKYNKTGKYSVKKRMTSTDPQAVSSAPSTPTGGRERLALHQMQPARTEHPDLRRFAALSIEQRRQRPEEIAHREEVGRRFCEALAMDRQMVQNPDWRTPFRNTKDAIERLLPFHVYQYSDRALDAGIAAAERSAAASSLTMALRLEKLGEQYSRILEREGSEHVYDVGIMQLEMERIDAAKAELERLNEIKLQHQLSSFIPAGGMSDMRLPRTPAATARAPHSAIQPRAAPHPNGTLH